MFETKKPIKTLLGFTRMTPLELLARATAVYKGITGNPAAFASPSIDMVLFKAEIDAYGSRITAALDGGRQALLERNQQTKVVIRMLLHLAHYVEVNCKDDMTTFQKSGFQAASTVRGTSQSLSQFIRKIVPGANAGEMLVTIAADPDAHSYDLRWGPVETGGTPSTWMSRPVTKIRPATSITGLTPGLAYVIQVRSVTKSGYSDWSDPITRICT